MNKKIDGRKNVSCESRGAVQILLLRVSVLFFAFLLYTGHLTLFTGVSYANWEIQTLDSAGDVGEYTSIALDTTNYPHISYCDGFPNWDLKYAKWTGTSWSTQTVDSAGDVGLWTSIALDTNNNPHISYSDYTNYDLKYAKWTDTSWSTQTVDSAGSVGEYTSIALDTNNNPHISYRASTNGDLKYAKWTGTSWSTQTVDSAGDVGVDTSIALDTTNYPHISYYDSTNVDLKYAKWTGSSWSIQTVDSAELVGRYTSIALDTNNNPHISYVDATNYNLRYATWTGSSWSIQTVDSAGSVGTWTSIALDTNNNPHISYYDATNLDLRYAKWTGTSWSIQAVDSAGDVGRDTSIALDTNNYPHISYYDNANFDLKYAKWTDTTPPAAVTNLSGQPGTAGNTIHLTWSAPGDDGWNNALPLGSQFKIQYSTNPDGNPPGLWDYGIAQITVSTSGVTPYTTQVTHTVTDLTGGTTYFFRIWHADEVPNWSGLSNTATSYAQAAILIVDITEVSFNFGQIFPGGSIISSSSATVTNMGNINATYQIKLTPPTGWTAGTTPGVDQFVFYVIVTTITPIAADFNAEDIVTTTLQTCSDTIFAGTGTKNGVNIPVGEKRYMWAYFRSPTQTSVETQQGIIITITPVSP